MLPPIPDAAGRLSAMAQQATLAPIQQAASMRGQSFAPPPVPQGGGIMAGLPGLMAGVKELAGVVQADKETQALAGFVKSALGGAGVPEGATPVEGLPWLGGDQQQGLPPVPPPPGAGGMPALTGQQNGVTPEGRPVMGNADGSVSTERSITVQRPDGAWTNIPTMYGGKEVSEDEATRIAEQNGWKDPETGRDFGTWGSVDEAVSAAKARSDQLGATIPSDGQKAPAYQAASNPLGFNERQTAMLRSMLQTGSRAQLEKAAGLIMTKAFDGPPEAQSALGKLLSDYQRLGGANPQIKKMYEAAIAKETAAPEAKAPQTRTINSGGREITQEWNPSTRTWSEVGSAPRWQPQQPKDPAAPVVRDFTEDNKIVTKQWNPKTGSWDPLSEASRFPVDPTKAPTTRTVTRGGQLVTEEWNPATNTWGVVAEAPRSEPGPVKAPETREVKRGDTVVTEQFDPVTQTWSEVGSAPRYNPSTTINVDTKGDTAYAKKRGEQLAATRQDLADRAQVARGTRARVQQATKLLGEIDTGALAPTFQGAKRIGKALGFDLAKIGVTDDVSAAENFTAITGQFLMDYIQQTKGAISEKENELFSSFSPNLGKTKEGNRMLLEWADGVAKRELDLNRLATQYEKEHGQLDAGWEDVKSRWQDEHPIIDVERTEAILGSAGNDIMSPAAPGTSAPLPKMGVAPELGKLSDQELLEQLRRQGYQIPRTQ